ncbi:urea transporter [Pontibacterium granulatum]|uniref:urea transporter n=1 Tax=Pontibacterium granulatum TaxID=2036029 RepID=UPI00249A4565|nr:urea transporter [Pontibacterium granulatum]MDI3324828.1 urea transporter [Pontibacterium granulatum]
MPYTHFLQSWLKGYSQIMLQSSCLTGLLFLLGIGLNSVPMLLGGILGGFIATLLSTLFRPSDALHQGLCGFNGALVGIAGVFFLQPSVASLSLIVICTLSATLLTRSLQRSSLPGFTAPFVVTTWVMLAAASLLGIPTSDLPVLQSDLPLLSSTLLGIGQVMFQGDILAGSCFVLGLIFSSGRHAALALIGSAAGCCAILIPGVSETLVTNGLYSFNPALTAIALSTSASCYPILRLVTGIAASVFFTHLFVLTEFPALTAPFVLATWSTFGLERLLRRPSTAVS